MLKKELEDLVTTLEDAIKDKDRELSKAHKDRETAEAFAKSLQEVHNENQTLADAISAREKEVSKWKNLAESNRDKITEYTEKRREIRLTEEENSVLKGRVANLTEEVNALKGAKESLKALELNNEQYKGIIQDYANKYNFVLGLLIKYKGAYEGFLKNVQGGIENSTELKFMLDEKLDLLKPKNENIKEDN